ncbi:hypothetical protein MMC16_001628 [Acarospora aff. strigata]|nr:hypothetical protein [Acarospora aff. strigata]
MLKASSPARPHATYQQHKPVSFPQLAISFHGFPSLSPVTICHEPPTNPSNRTGKILSIPIYATTQNASRLGPTCTELALDSTYPTLEHVDKTAFSMMIPQIARHFTPVSPSSPTPSSTSSSNPSLPSSSSSSSAQNQNQNQDKGSGPREIVVVGIEAHICVTQTTLDLLAQGHKVYVLADGVSSCNREEVPVALRRLAREGAVVTTSESWLYECMGDAGIAEFKAMAALVKESKESTKAGLETLCKI